MEEEGEEEPNNIDRFPIRYGNHLLVRMVKE